MIRTAMPRLGLPRLGLWLAMGLAMLTAAAVHAYEVSPMRIFLVPAEGRTQATLSINNTRNEPLPVEIKTFRRITEADGSERLEDAEGAFIIFPPQVQVAANSSQAIRLQYVGPQEVSESQGYVVQVVEVPVNPPGFSGVRFTYNFGAAVYIEPPRATERLSVVSAERSERGLRVVVRNSGTRHGILNEHRLIVTAGAQRFDFGMDELAERVENPLLPPNMDRIVDIKLPELAAEGAVTAELRTR